MKWSQLKRILLVFNKNQHYNNLLPIEEFPSKQNKFFFLRMGGEWGVQSAESRCETFMKIQKLHV